jgi:hypothetical protein
MAHARQQDGWNHTASVLAMLANVNRDPKKRRAFKPADFHPIPAARRAESPPPLKGEIGMLKKVFVDRQPERS